MPRPIALIKKVRPDCSCKLGPFEHAVAELYVDRMVDDLVWSLGSVKIASAVVVPHERHMYQVKLLRSPTTLPLHLLQSHALELQKKREYKDDFQELCSWPNFSYRPAPLEITIQNHAGAFNKLSFAVGRGKLAGDWSSERQQDDIL